MEFLCIDLGATSGRHIVGKIEDGKITLKVTFRFENYFIDDYYWDINYLYQKVIEGIDVTLAKGHRPLSLAIDAWGVDYVEGDSERALSYRAPDNMKNVNGVNDIFSSKELFSLTGISPQEINTIYRVNDATRDILFIRDYIVYRLTGEKYSDITIASTSQLFDVKNLRVATEIVDKVAPNLELPPIVKPGEVYIPANDYDIEVLVGAGHDTANCFYLYEKERNAVILNVGTWAILGANTGGPIINDLAYENGFSNEAGVNNIRFLKNMLGMYLLEVFLKQEKLGKDYPAIIAKMIENNHDKHISIHGIDLDSSLLEQFKLQYPQENNYWYLNLIVNSLVNEYSLNVNLVGQLTNLTIEKLVVMGGATKNSVFMEKLKNKLVGIEIVMGDDEATALGNIQLQYDSWIKRK